MILGEKSLDNHASFFVSCMTHEYQHLITHIMVFQSWNMAASFGMDVDRSTCILVLWPQSQLTVACNLCSFSICWWNPSFSSNSSCLVFEWQLLKLPHFRSLSIFYIIVTLHYITWLAPICKYPSLNRYFVSAIRRMITMIIYFFI